MLRANVQPRFGSFFDRVETERAALKLVNGTAGPVVALHGLSRAAIDRWLAEHERLNSASKSVRRTASILHRLSARIDAQADQSRVVFAGERFAVFPTTELLEELTTSCATDAIAAATPDRVI